MGVLVETRGAVRLVRINRPEVHNCVNLEAADGLRAALRDFLADDAARVMILAGAGTQAFCSGADLKAVDGLFASPRVAEDGPMGFSRVTDVHKPTIAAINGYCFAGGLELACWADFRIADERAAFGVLNRRWGVSLIDGGTQRLPRIVGLGNALYLIETGAQIDAQTALRMGLIQEIVPEGQAVERAVALAERLAEYPQASLRADREAALAGWTLPLNEGLRLEARLGEATLNDPETAAGLQRFRSGDRPAPPRAG